MEKSLIIDVAYGSDRYFQCDKPASAMHHEFHEPIFFGLQTWRQSWMATPPPAANAL
jgi:hypothetical protein